MTSMVLVSPDELRALVRGAMRDELQAARADTSTTAGGDVLTRKEAADLLKVNAATIVRWVKTKGLPGKQLPGGRDWRFRRDELMRWLETSRGRPLRVVNGGG